MSAARPFPIPPGVECRAFRKTDGLIAPVHNDSPGLSPPARGKGQGRLLPEVFKTRVVAEGHQIAQDRRVEGPRGGAPSLEGALDQLDGLGGDPHRPRGCQVQARDLAVLAEPAPEGLQLVDALAPELQNLGAGPDGDEVDLRPHGSEEELPCGLH